MSDIVDRLRHPWEIDLPDLQIEYVPAKIGQEAAAEIARLRARVAELEADRKRWRAIADDCHSWLSLILHRGYNTQHSASETDIKTMLSRIDAARAATDAAREVRSE